jgi:hypothetical protein
MIWMPVTEVGHSFVEVLIVADRAAGGQREGKDLGRVGLYKRRLFRAAIKKLIFFLNSNPNTT